MDGNSKLDEVYFAMKTDLLTLAKNVMIIDPRPPLKNLTKREKNQLNKYSNDWFWYEASLERVQVSQNS